MPQRKSWLWTLLLLSLLAPSGCDGGAVSGAVVWEGTHVYEEGTSVQGQLVVLGGEVIIREGAQVTGSVYILGGDVQVAGDIGQDVAIISGDLLLSPSAVIAGDLSLGGGDVQRSPQATVLGQVVGEADVDVNLQNIFPQPTPRQRLLRLLPQALITAALAYLLARFLGGPLSRVSRAGAGHPIVSGAMGLLVAIVGPSLLVLMAFTVILIPVTLIALIITGAVVVYAWIGLGAALGKWLRGTLQREWPAPLSAFVGTFVFMAVTDLLVFIPFVGGWIGILATVVGIGAVFLTRFGLREFDPSYDFAPPEFGPP